MAMLLLLLLLLLARVQASEPFVGVAPNGSLLVQSSAGQDVFVDGVSFKSLIAQTEHLAQLEQRLAALERLRQPVFGTVDFAEHEAPFESSSFWYIRKNVSVPGLAGAYRLHASFAARPTYIGTCQSTTLRLHLRANEVLCSTQSIIHPNACSATLFGETTCITTVNVSGLTSPLQIRAEQAINDENLNGWTQSTITAATLSYTLFPI
mgnify:CR=1 FL=1